MPFVGRGGVLSAVGKIDVAGINGGEFCNHLGSLRIIGCRRRKNAASQVRFPTLSHFASRRHLRLTTSRPRLTG
jgi:hypothetical protein